MSLQNRDDFSTSAMQHGFSTIPMLLLGTRKINGLKGDEHVSTKQSNTFH